MAPDYPLLLAPHLAGRVWGGTRLGDGIGEAWDLSVHPDGPCTIANGPLRGRTLREVVAGDADAFGGPIELLAKRLDCRETLSVQVHPKEGDTKTEAWVVLEAEPGAAVYHGFGRPVTRAQVAAAARDATLPDLLRSVPVRAGDAVFVPTGTVHAIGGGLYLFEIQQSANTTYRLYDWGRGRDLHLEEGLAHADLATGEALPAPRPLPGGGERILACPFFSVDRHDGADPVALDPGGRWRALLVEDGAGAVDGVAVGAGGTVLVPRAAGPRRFEPAGHARVLVYGPPVA